MSHHYSGPAFRFPHEDGRLDFSDLYAFPKAGDAPFRTSSTKAPPRWTENAHPNLIHYNKLDRGGHFKAWEQPELFVQGLRSSRCAN
jgi:pimeloyl-ACP methyl ester carboxylesterase